MSSEVAASSSPEIVAARPRGLALAAFILLVIAAAIAYLVSGLFAMLVLVLTPEPGAEAYVLILKGALVGGWLAIGGWLVWDVSRLRWRFAAAPVAAWAWMYGILELMSGSAFLNIGY